MSNKMSDLRLVVGVFTYVNKGYELEVVVEDD